MFELGDHLINVINELQNKSYDFVLYYSSGSSTMIEVLEVEKIWFNFNNMVDNIESII